MHRSALRPLLLIILLFSSGVALTQSRSITDQIIVNTQRLNDLERRMRQVEIGGSDADGQIAAKTTIHEIKIERLQQDIAEMKSVLVGVAVFVITHVVGFIIYLLKSRATKQEKERIDFGA